MKIHKPEREVEVCDRCHREGFLQECLVCGGQYCLTCDAIMAGCWVSPRVCRRCGGRPDVQRVVTEAAERITPIIEERRASLSALPKEGDGRDDEGQ